MNTHNSNQTRLWAIAATLRVGHAMRSGSRARGGRREPRSCSADTAATNGVVDEIAEMDDEERVSRERRFDSKQRGRSSTPVARRC